MCIFAEVSAAGIITKDHVIAVCGSIAKWRDRKSPCERRKKNSENYEIALPYTKFKDHAHKGSAEILKLMAVLSHGEYSDSEARGSSALPHCKQV